MGFFVILICSNLPMAGTMEKDAKEWGNKMQRASLKALREKFPEVSSDQGFLQGIWKRRFIRVFQSEHLAIV